MSPLPTFFRVPHPQGPVLVRVSPRSSTKSRPLDLELRATDDVRAFVLPRKSGPFLHPPCHHLFFAGGPRQSGLVGRIRACISATMRAVIILQPHPMCHPVQPPRPAPGPANCNCRCGNRSAGLGGRTV